MARLNDGDDVTLERLTTADVAAAAALSRAIGWNQTEADWSRLVATAGSEVFAARSSDGVVGTASLVRYGATLGWLGMVIVHPDLRGRGLGGALVDHVLDVWDAAPGAVLGLDATEYGAPLYERRGFTTVATIDRWLGPATSVADASPPLTRPRDVSVRLAGAADGRSIIDLDQRHALVDRSALLHQLIAESLAGPERARAAAGRVFVAERAGALIGYTAVRPGRERPHIGPVVAVDDAAADALLSATSAPSAEAGAGAYLDAVRDPRRTRLLHARGYEVARTLQRMTKSIQSSSTQAGEERNAAMSTPPLSGDALVAAMGFEWG